MLNKSIDEESASFPDGFPAATVFGMLSAVKPLRMAAGISTCAYLLFGYAAASVNMGSKPPLLSRLPHQESRSAVTDT